MQKFIRAEVYYKMLILDNKQEGLLHSITKNKMVSKSILFFFCSFLIFCPIAKADNYFESEKFKIKFPDAPEKTTRPGKLEGIGEVTIISYNFSGDDVNYTLNMFDIPDGTFTSEAETEVFYLGTINGFSYSMGRDLIETETVKLKEFKGKEFDLRNSGLEGHIIGRIFLIDNTVYLFTAISEREHNTAELIDFVRSFELK